MGNKEKSDELLKIFSAVFVPPLPFEGNIKLLEFYSTCMKKFEGDPQITSIITQLSSFPHDGILECFRNSFTAITILYGREMKIKEGKREETRVSPIIFDMVKYLQRIVLEKQRALKKLQIVELPITRYDWGVSGHAHKIPNELWQHIISYLEKSESVALMTLTENSDESRSLDWKKSNFFVCVLPRFSDMSDVDQYLRCVIHDNFSVQMCGMLFVDRLVFGRNFCGRSREGGFLSHILNEFGVEGRKVAVGAERNIVTQIAARIHSTLSQKKQVFAMIAWLFCEAKKISIENPLDRTSGIVIEHSDAKDVYTALSHSNLGSVRRVIFAMLLGIIDSSFCIELQDELLEKLLSFALAAEGFHMSSEWSYQVSLPVISNLLLFTDMIADEAIAPAVFQLGEHLYTLSSGYIFSEGGIVAYQGNHDFACKSPAMLAEGIMSFLNGSWDNLKKHMQSMLGILKLCKTARQQHDFIHDIQSMLSAAEIETQNLRQQLFAGGGLPALVIPNVSVKNLSDRQLEAFNGLLEIWQRRLAPALEARRPRP
jgi:hypothetical protein